MCQRLIFLLIFLLSLAATGINAQPGTEQVTSWLDRARTFSQKNLPDSAINCAEQALLLLGRQPDEATKAGVLTLIARAYQAKGQFPNALKYYLQASNAYDKLRDEKSLAEIEMELGALYETAGADDRAWEYFFKAYQLRPAGTEVGSRIQTLHKLAFASQRLEKHDDALTYYHELLGLYRQQDNKRGVVTILKNISDIYKTTHQYEKALESSLQVLDLNRTAKDSAGMAVSVNNAGYLYKYLENYSKSIEYFREALQIYKNLHSDESEITETLINLSAGSQYIGDPLNALKYLFEATRIKKNKGNASEVADIYNYISAIYYNIQYFDDARYYCQEAIHLAEKARAKDVLVISYKTMSMIEEKLDDYRQSLAYYQLHSAMKDSIYYEERLRQQALLRKRFDVERTEKELKLLLMDNEKQDLAFRQLQLEAEKKQKDVELLLREKSLQDFTLKNQQLEKDKAIQTLQLTHQRLEAEKKGRQILVLQKDREIQALTIREKEVLEKERQKEIALLASDKKLLEQKRALQDLELEKKKATLQYFWGIGLLMVIILLLIIVSYIFSVRANRKLEQKNNEINHQKLQIEKQRDDLMELNEEMNQQKEEIMTQRDALASKSLEISKKNEDITASINYAQRIQSAILPVDEGMAQSLPEHFVLFRPRDIVSGDFYWFSEVKKDGHDKVLVATVDCTGHGVPGAFMSLIGNVLLNQIVNDYGITDADLILNEMHKSIRKVLRQAETQIRDGMDMALCVIDRKNNTLSYAGAKNPLFIVRHNEQNQPELIDIKGDKTPIGGQQFEQERVFTRHTFELSTPTTFYIFTDGYPDQFGGLNDKKFMIKRFRELLFDIHAKPLQVQKTMLNDVLEDWIAQSTGQSQIDDVLVMGVRIS